MAKNTSKGAPAASRSPLYTSRAAELAKRKDLQDLGRDRDGAYRATRRIDGGTRAAD